MKKLFGILIGAGALFYVGKKGYMGPKMARSGEYKKFPSNKIIDEDHNLVFWKLEELERKQGINLGRQGVSTSIDDFDAVKGYRQYKWEAKDEDTGEWYYGTALINKRKKGLGMMERVIIKGNNKLSEGTVAEQKRLI